MNRKSKEAAKRDIEYNNRERKYAAHVKEVKKAVAEDETAPGPTKAKARKLGLTETGPFTMEGEVTVRNRRFKAIDDAKRAKKMKKGGQVTVCRGMGKAIRGGHFSKSG